MSPTFISETFETTSDTRFSYTFGPAITRVAAVQSCPELK